MKGKPKPLPAIELIDNSKVQVQIHAHKVLTLVDLQTKGCDLINSQFVYHYKILTILIEKKSLSTEIK